MPQQYNGIIAQQTVIFRGASTISCMQQRPDFPNFKAITGSRYTCEVTGGVSGSFGVLIFGQIGGSSVVLAGLTTLAAGLNAVYPITYDEAGAINALEATLVVTDTRFDQIVPPSSVMFQAGGAANAIGISATITVSAVLSSE